MDFVRPARAVPISLVAGKGHYHSVVEAVLAAERSVWIATANLKELMVQDPRLRPGKARTARGTYRSVIEVFDELAAKDVELRILHAGFPSRAFREEFDKHPRLMRGGLELRLCPRVHLKAVIVDARHLYLGSANWTGAGLGAKGEGRRNFELGFTTDDELMIDEVQALFDTIWQGAACAGCKLRDLCEAPLDGQREVTQIRRRSAKALPKPVARTARPRRRG
jgi:phosphatidylserine/phosphatidylglycerophosphate/cardiolipin synthase-like enzyme